jgi:gamma-glutamyl hydrolase
MNNRWTSNADYILKYAINENNKGNVFPVWGTCLGLQLLSFLTSGYDSKVLSAVRGEVALLNTLNILKSSYLLEDISTDLKNKLTKGQGITYFNHHYAVTTTYYQNNKNFNTFWNLIATTRSSYND